MSDTKDATKKNDTQENIDAVTPSRSLTPYELVKLNKVVNQLSDLKSTLADAALQKEQHMRKLAAEFDKIYDDISPKINLEQTLLNNLIKDFDEQYGQSNYNHQTGEILEVKAST